MCVCVVARWWLGGCALLCFVCCFVVKVVLRSSFHSILLLTNFAFLFLHFIFDIDDGGGGGGAFVGS